MEEKGITAVRKRVQGSPFEWIFRDVRIPDVGIDAHIETVKNGYPTGRLIACQIKSGESYFRESNKQRIIYRGDTSHLEYWLNYLLAVVVFLYSPKEDEVYWGEVKQESIERTKAGWKLEIPRTQRLNSDSRDDLEVIAEGRPELRRLRKLWADKPLIEAAMYADTQLQLTGHIKVSSVIPHGFLTIVKKKDKHKEVLASYWMPYWPDAENVTAFLESLFPWAQISNEEDEIRREYILEDLYDTLHGYYAEGELVMHGEEWSEFIKDYEGFNYLGLLQHIAEDQKYWDFSIEISANELGEAFLIVDKYLKEANLGR